MNNARQDPLVSVIIPAYNQGPLLVRAIESALGQTYSPVEIVVVNDGSSSPVTRETVEPYLGRIVYLERENGRVAAARNAGVEVCKGELIAWLDQDDVWLPNKLEVEVRALQAHPEVALVHSSYYLIDKAGRRTSLVRLREREWQALPELLVKGTICTSSVLMPREVLAGSGSLDPELNGADDWDLYLRLAARGYSFFCVGEPLAEYRIHQENTATKPELMLNVWVKMLDKFYALPGLSEEVVRWKGRTYFQKYAAAVALYYGAGNLEAARTGLKKAAGHYPKGIATGRFLQSLIYSRSSQPTLSTAEDAVRFVSDSLKGERLPAGIRRKLESRSWLVLALHDGGRVGRRARDLGRALGADPSMLVDRELWAVGGRLPGRVVSKLKARGRAAGVAEVAGE